LKDIGAERGRLGLMDVENLAREMRPAGDLDDAPGLVGLVISGIGIGLEMAGEAGKFGLRVCAGAIGREPIPDERRRT